MKNLIGINIGSQSSVVSVLRGKVLDVVLSDTSNRTVPTVVAFNDRERTFADSALSTIKSNLHRTVIYPNRWLGLQKDWPFVEEEAKFANMPPTVDANNQLGFEITTKRQVDIYSSESLMGIYFTKLKNNWLRAGYDTNEVVVSVPDYYTAYERKAMLDSLTIAGLSCSALLNESSAIALSYGIMRRNQFNNKNPRYVCFVDMGQAKTTVFFASFTHKVMKVISVASERFCGAREFDYILTQHLSNVFQRKYGCNPTSSPKAKLRLMNSIAKARKMLTADTKTLVNVESLMEDMDLTYNLTRDEFEELIKPVLNKFKNLLERALSSAIDEGTDLDSVEMVGDAVRTQIIQQIIKDVLGLDISKTMLPDECISRGCALYAAMISQFYTLGDFTFEHYNPYSINIEYPLHSKNFIKSLEDGQIQKKTYNLFAKSENIPSRKVITFNEKQIPQMDTLKMRYLYSSSELPWLSNTLLNTFIVTIPNVIENNWSLSLQFYLDQNCLPFLDRANIHEAYSEADQIEKAPVKKERHTLCLITPVEVTYGTPQKLMDMMIQREQTQEKEDIRFRDVLNKRNEIENFMYSTKSKLNNELAEYATTQEKDNIISLMNQLEEWLYSDDEEVYNKDILEEKSVDIYIQSQKINNRCHSWENLCRCLQSIEDKIKYWKTKVDLEIRSKWKHVNTYEVNQAISNITTQVKKWNEKLLQCQRCEHPPIDYEDVEKSASNFHNLVTSFYANSDSKVTLEEE